MQQNKQLCFLDYEKGKYKIEFLGNNKYIISVFEYSNDYPAGCYFPLFILDAPNLDVACYKLEKVIEKMKIIMNAQEP